MSARKYVDIWCDGCGNWHEGDGLSHTAKDARYSAALSGWKVSLPGGQDLCPPCAREALASVPSVPGPVREGE